MKAIVLLGRILFFLIFLVSSIGHFSAQNIQYAAAQGLPLANVLVQQMQLAMFLKNVSISGAALLISYFGSGPLSIDQEYTANV